MQRNERIARRLTDITCALVEIPTENRPPTGFEKPGQEYLAARLRELGLSVCEASPYDVEGFAGHPAFLQDRDYEGRYNIIGRWKGEGGGRSLLLSGHMDVAPKEPMPWIVTEPYKSLVRDGRIYGRGAADMKGGLACAYVAVAELMESGFKPRGDILLESVIDEEFAGATGTIASRILGYNTDFGIVLEPSGLSVCTACVGGIVVKLSVKGIAGMPYTGEEVKNPAYDISRVIQSVGRYDAVRSQSLTKPPLWAQTPQTPQIIITKLKAGEVEPHGQLTTPVDAWAEIVIQTYPHEAAERVIADFERFVREDSGVEFELEMMYHYCKPAAPSIDTPAPEMLLKSARKHTDDAKICGAMFSCDLFAFEEFGSMPAAVFGPIGERLHGPDEWVDVESMVTVTKTLMDFIREWCG